MAKKKAKSDRDQADRFKEVARKVEADESGDAFEKAFKTIAPAKTRPQGKPQSDSA